ncbi:hypothetical protein OAN33_00845 [Flavobacteriales bacterium]|nr:hypothetical protein [Flavobacteriales bacterium]
MKEENIKFSKSNEWKEPIAYVGLFFILLFIISLIISQIIISFLFLTAGLLILGKGKITTVDFEKNIVTIEPTILSIPVGNKKTEIIKDLFNKLKITQFSEFAGRQFFVFSSSVRVREYRLDFLSSENSTSYRLISSEDYNEVKNMANKIIKNWNYTIDDEIQKKMVKNKKEREQRKKKK